ncbi:cuticular protein RR-2 motif 132 [Aphomia sociella]
MALLLLLFLTRVNTEEVATPASLLGPRNFNHHSYDVGNLQRFKLPEPTKQGPVLFPNDGPPPPRQPLIVTSRPLIEALAKSELNNSIAEQSQINGIYQPGFLARDKNYKPYNFPVPTIVPATYDDSTIQYGAFQKIKQFGDNRYYNYEGQTVLPPIYQAISDHAREKVLKIQQKPTSQRYDYEIKQPNYSHRNQGSDDYDDSSDPGKNYAFSYTVKDHKTGDDFSHSQQSSGSATNGEYRVRLPDGRMQIVSYTADENGYKADVRYDDDDKTVGNTIDKNINDNQDYNNKHSYDYNHDYKYNNKINNNDYNDKYNHNDKYSHNYNFKHNHDYKNHDNINDDNRKNYLNNDYKIDNNQKYDTPTNNYYNDYSDASKEYYNNDFSTEYESKNYDYEPHKSKYDDFKDSTVGAIVVPDYKKYTASTTVRPSFDELKGLFLDKQIYSTVQPVDYQSKVPFEINVPSTTPVPYDGTTEHVVVIGTKKPTLYTNIKNSVPVTISPLSLFSTAGNFVSSTPKGYLASTLSHLRDKITSITQKPVLSDSFISRINKYLSFN